MINRYQNTKVTKTENEGNEIYVNSVYPDIPYSNSDVYVITTLGDRLDILANNIYGDTSLWWIISSANQLPGDSLTPPIGIQLRIPTDLQPILNAYKSINIIR
jgi:hypothetical protein